MNQNILNKEVQQFISENVYTEPTTLILKGSPFDRISAKELVDQIVSKQRSKKKLHTWFSTENIYYPSKISIEQSSSEITAHYKTTLVYGDSIIDICGGFGVDAYYFSKQFKNLIHCELNEELSEIVHHNFHQFTIKNCTFFSGDGIEFLKNTDEHFDCIYIDPSRRNDAKGKVFLLKDCLPNVPENLELFFSRSNQILIKNSPILDITNTINELQSVKEIHIVAVNNEVKELLFLLENAYQQEIKIKTVNFQKKITQEFEFIYQQKASSEYSTPLTYLYEPNAALLKSGGFHQISSQLNLYKLHQHSHLYTSNELLEFPGRRFTIEHIIPYNKKKIARLLPNNKANITTRNFPKTVAEIRKQTNIKEGGNTYLFFTTDHSNKLIVIFCQQIFDTVIGKKVTTIKKSG